MSITFSILSEEEFAIPYEYDGEEFLHWQRLHDINLSNANAYRLFDIFLDDGYEFDYAGQWNPGDLYFIKLRLESYLPEFKYAPEEDQWSAYWKARLESFVELVDTAIAMESPVVWG